MAYLIEYNEKSQLMKALVVDRFKETNYKLLPLNFKLSNGQLIFYVRHMQSTLVVKIYA